MVGSWRTFGIASMGQKQWMRMGYDDMRYIAAQNGHLEVLQWARNNGCDWDSDTCACAAQNGHLEVLQWARNNGCDWDSDTCA